MIIEVTTANSTACVTKTTAGEPPGGNFTRTPGTNAAKRSVDKTRLTISIFTKNGFNLFVPRTD